MIADERIVPSLEPGLVPSLLAAGDPDAPALLQLAGRTFSFASLRERVDWYAARLRELGIAGHDLIAIETPDPAESLCAFLGVAAVCAAAPLDTTLTESEYHALLARLGVRALLTNAGPESCAEAAARALGVPVIALGYGTDRPTWRSASAGIPLRQPRQLPQGVVLVLETSATTGVPKLVPLTSGNLMAIAACMQRALDLNARDRFLAIMPLTHLLGLACPLAQLLRGGSVICAGGFSPDRFAASLREFRPTWYSASPTLHRAILDLARRLPPVLNTASLRFIRSGSAALDPGLRESLEQVLRVPVMDGYGLTEAGQVTSNPPARRKPGSVGGPLGTSVGIMDDTGNLLPAGSAGEIVLRGPAVFHGYLDDAEANHAAFRSGWFRTGDLGRVDGDGDLFIAGRIKEAINRGGETIAPREIDDALAGHPAVAEAVAFAVRHPTLGEDVAAAVVLRAGANASEPELRRFLAGRLSFSRLPNRIVFLDHIPTGRNGKPRRGVLSEQFRELPVVPDDSLPDPTEQRIAYIWMRVLGIAQPGPSDNFFALGGDSLSAAVMLNAVRTELCAAEPQLEMADFFESPTVERLASIVGLRGVGRPAPSGDNARLVWQSRAQGVPFFCLPGASQDGCYLRHVAQLVRAERSFIVLTHPIVDGRPWPSVDDLATRFLAQIRATRPAGPYMLGGHCYGGILAFECALRLVALGESVPLLVLFDTPTPGYPKPARHWKQYARHAVRLISGAERGNPYRATEIAAHIRFVVRNFRPNSAGHVPHQPVAAGPQAPPQPHHPSGAAAIVHGYRPKPFAGKIVHFIAEGAPVSSRILEDSRLGWRDFALGGFEVQSVSGLHDSMFIGEHAPDLATRLLSVFRG
jgi:oxalate---CoA ligase